MSKPMIKVKEIVAQEIESYGEYAQDCRIVILKGREQVACEYIDNCPGDIKPYMECEVGFVQYYSESTYIKIKE